MSHKSGIIIAFAGGVGAGKTTSVEAFSKLMCETYGPIAGHVREMNFGDALKRDLAHLLGFPYNLCYTREGKATIAYAGPKPQTVGQALQTFGQGMRDMFGETYWVDKLMVSVDKWTVNNPLTTVAVGDLRYRVEEEALLKRGAILIRLESARTALPDSSGRDRSHQSENDLSDFSNYTVINADINNPEQVAKLCVALVEARAEKLAALAQQEREQK
jgi:hypothetical protein